MELQCTRCQGVKLVRNGKSRHGHQRYLCRGCGLTFGDEDKRLVSAQLKENALRHYAEGVGLRATERLVGVSHNSVMNWVKQEVAGKALQKIDISDVKVIEADEMWTYAGQKKAQFGSGGLLIALPKEWSGGFWVIATPARPEH